MFGPSLDMLLTGQQAAGHPGGRTNTGLRVHIADQPDALLVPQVALGSGQLGRFVYVVGKDGKAEQRIVSPGATYGSLIVIDKGVNEGDRIIVGNLQKIAAGVPVQPEPSKDGAT